MTTAVAPKNAKNWEEVFPNPPYPDEGPIWSVINTLLYQHGMDARFGFEGLPEDKISPTERILLVLFRDWPRLLSVEYNSEGYERLCTSLGEYIYILLNLAKAEPVTGHFVGRGFEQNNKDADRFLGAK